MIEEAEKDGHLQPGQTILEPSSGNTGIALAAIARIKGYPIKILLPENVSIERRQMLEVFGAEIILTPGEEGSNGAVRRAQEMAAEHPEWCFLYQYGNDANPRAHYESTGPEIWPRLPRDHPLRRRPRHQRHADGRRAVPQGAQPGRQGRSPSSRRSASGSRGCATSTTATSRRCSSSGTASTCSTASASCAPRVAASGPAAWSRVRRVRRHLGRRGAGRGGQGSGRDRARARSSSSSATAAGSTSRPAPTPTTSTSPQRQPSRSSTSDLRCLYLCVCLGDI